jgi:hypothetical protein
MIRTAAVTVLAAALGAGASLAAETEDTADLKQQIDELNRRVEAMEKRESLFQGGESWVDRFTLSGDMTYRHEMIRREEPDADEEIQHRHRFRLRVAVAATVNQEFLFKLQLATGTGSATATFRDFDDGFSNKPIYIDQAYIRYRPAVLEDYGFEAVAGKVPNPFFRPGKTQLIWDGDLTPEGGAVKAKLKLEPLEVFCTAGGFWVEEDPDNSDNGLWGVQGGVKWPVLDTGITVVAGGSGFWFTPSKNEGPFTAARRNSIDPVDGGYLYEFNLAEAFAEVHFKLFEIPVVVYGDFVENTDAANENTAWTVGVTVGKKKEQWDWDFKYAFRDIEQDAVIGSLNDGTFGAGGTNCRGHVINAGIRLARNVDFGVTYFINEIDEEGLAPPGEEEVDYDRLQVDVVVKF